jgi:dihydropteroate synthase
VSAADEIARVVPVIEGLAAKLPDTPLSVDTRKPEVAAAALDAGADILNDVAGVTGDGTMAALAAERGAAYVLMHDRPTPTTADLVERVIQDLGVAVERAVARGCPRGSLLVDPGIGFGKDAAGNLALLRDLARLRTLGLPVLLGASRKSTIGRVLDLPPDDRLEGTLATTVLGVAAGVDVVRVHDVRANVRAARMADAVVRGWTDQRIEGVP